MTAGTSFQMVAAGDVMLKDSSHLIGRGVTAIGPRVTGGPELISTGETRMLAGPLNPDEYADAIGTIAGIQAFEAGWFTRPGFPAGKSMIW